MDIKEIIRTYNHFDSLYMNGLTNHLNMGLFALYKMGAVETEIRNYAEFYSHEKELAELKPALFKITEENFMKYTGREESYSSFILFFQELFLRYSASDVVSKYLNILINGCAGGAFHGIIRLAYAVELGDSDELIKALSYLSECYCVLRNHPAVRQTNDPVQVILDFKHQAYFRNFVFIRPLIVGRMMDINEDEIFQGKVTALENKMRSYSMILSLVLNLYAMTDDFTILHGVTSTHALCVLKPYLDQFDKILDLHWYHLQLAYVSTGCVGLKEVNIPDEIEAWDAIFKKTVLKSDIHTLKLVYSLYSLSKHKSDDSLLRFLAVRKLKSSK